MEQQEEYKTYNTRNATRGINFLAALDEVTNESAMRLPLEMLQHSCEDLFSDDLHRRRSAYQFFKVVDTTGYVLSFDTIIESMNLSPDYVRRVILTRYNEFLAHEAE